MSKGTPEKRSFLERIVNGDSYAVQHLNEGRNGWHYHDAIQISFDDRIHKVDVAKALSKYFADFLNEYYHPLGANKSKNWIVKSKWDMLGTGEMGISTPYAILNQKTEKIDYVVEYGIHKNIIIYDAKKLDEKEIKMEDSEGKVITRNFLNTLSLDSALYKAEKLGLTAKTKDDLRCSFGPFEEYDPSNADENSFFYNHLSRRCPSPNRFATGRADFLHLGKDMYILKSDKESLNSFVDLLFSGKYHVLDLGTFDRKPKNNIMRWNKVPLKDAVDNIKLMITYLKN